MLRVNRYLIFFVVFLVLQGVAFAGSAAIWPFNTPYMEARRICKNATTWADNAVYANDSKLRSDLLGELSYQKKMSLNNDPKYAAWTNIYYSEIEHYIRLIWRNPNVTTSMAEELIESECDNRMESTEKKLKEYDPRS